MTLYELGCEYESTEQLLTQCINHASESRAEAKNAGQVQRVYEIMNYLNDLYAQRAHVRKLAAKLKHYYDEPEGAAYYPRTLLVTTQSCPNCSNAERVLNSAGVVFEKIVANDQPDVAVRYDILLAPTLVIDYGSRYDKVENLSNIIKYAKEHGGAT